MKSFQRVCPFGAFCDGCIMAELKGGKSMAARDVEQVKKHVIDYKC